MRKIYISLLLLLISAKAYSQGDPFSLDVSSSGTELNVAFSMEDGNYLYADSIVVSVRGIILKPVSMPEPVIKPDPATEEDGNFYFGRLDLVYNLPNTGEDLVEVAYQGCTEAVCFLPQTREFRLSGAGAVQSATEHEISDGSGNMLAGFIVAGTESGYMREDAFTAFIEGALAGAPARKGLADRGIGLMILLILIGGLSLNLTPCVLPMIPINIAIIGAGAGGASRTKGFVLGSVYGAGITLAYGTLGLLVVLAGTRFGTLNSSPWFNAGIALIFGLLSISMFGIFNLDFSRLQGNFRSGEGGKGRLTVSFFLGAIAALLAGACVAPVVISVLILSADLYQSGNFAGLILPFVLGLGMALPWPFAGAGVSFLPKPGPWMEKIKYAFGVIILGGAVYYGFQAAVLFEGRSESSRREAIALQAENIDEGGWYNDLDRALENARISGKPVFIDFWAVWCSNCLKMERTTFKAAPVIEVLDQFVRVKFRADNLRDPEIKSVLDIFGVVGLPSYVVLVKEDKQNQSLD